MKLTVRQLQLYAEEQLEKMTIRIERAERHYSELHDRIDRTMRVEFEKNFADTQQECVSLLSILNESFTEVSRHQNVQKID